MILCLLSFYKFQLLFLLFQNDYIHVYLFYLRKTFICENKHLETTVFFLNKIFLLFF